MTINYEGVDINSEASLIQLAVLNHAQMNLLTELLIDIRAKLDETTSDEIREKYKDVVKNGIDSARDYLVPLSK